MKINYFTKIKEKKCDLIFFNQLKTFVKNAERVFFLSAKKNCIRGNHAHKICSQYLISINGNIKIKIDNGKIKKDIIIKELKEMIKIKPMTWLTINLKKNQKLCVICDKKYSKKEYIRDYEIFNKIKKD